MPLEPTARDYEYNWGSDEARDTPPGLRIQACNSWADRIRAYPATDRDGSISSARRWHCAWLLGFHDRIDR